MRKTKTTKYRTLLERISKIIDERSNMEDFSCGNRSSLTIYDAHRLTDCLNKFEEIKKSR